MQALVRIFYWPEFNSKNNVTTCFDDVPEESKGVGLSRRMVLPVFVSYLTVVDSQLLKRFFMAVLLRSPYGSFFTAEKTIFFPSVSNMKSFNVSLGETRIKRGASSSNLPPALFVRRKVEFVGALAGIVTLNHDIP